MTSGFLCYSVVYDSEEKAMAFQLFNMNGVLAKNLQDIHDIYYILKKNDEVYESNINLYKEPHSQLEISNSN